MVRRAITEWMQPTVLPFFLDHCVGLHMCVFSIIKEAKRREGRLKYMTSMQSVFLPWTMPKQGNDLGIAISRAITAFFSIKKYLQMFKVFSRTD